MLELNEIGNPFPGIRPFEMDEANLFFGRDGQSDELLKRLQRTRLLAVVGTSGSGKSSLIRAGLLPALYGGLMGDAGSNWRIAIQRPGGDPIGNLAAALAGAHVFGSTGDADIQSALIETTLRRSSIGLIDVVRQAGMNQHENLLVVVDQFEELFRFKQSQTGDDATTFVKLLLEAAAQQQTPIYVILTMRSDFLGDCSQFTGLPEAINDGQYLIPRMSRDERQAAIAGPIAVGQGEISAPLISRLLNDVGDNPDQLPILQHALMRTWDYWCARRRNGEAIDLEDYTAIGTMSEALSRHADEAFNELPDEPSRLIAEKLFKRLTEKGADNREIRRPTSLAELCAVCAAGKDELVSIIEVFRREGRSFLMPPAGTDLTTETVIDISHESLIRNWKRLQNWVDEEAQSSRIYRRLADAAVLHSEGHEGLLQDPGLQMTLDWFEKTRPNAAWAGRYHAAFAEATKYLAESCEAREEAQRERERQRNAELERERRDREQAEMYAAGQARAARRLRWLSVGMAVMFLLALATAAYALVARSQAVANEKNATAAHDVAVEARKKAESLQIEADASAKEARAAADRLTIEKENAESLAKKLFQEQTKTKAALISEQLSVAAKERAVSAAQKAAEVARANADQFKAAVDRTSLMREGVEAFRREEHDDALTKFEELRKTLEPLQANAKAAASAVAADPKQQRQFAIDYGWANSRIGATKLLLYDNYEAKEAFQQALQILGPLADKDDPLSKDPLLFETYNGLGQAYQALAVDATAGRSTGDQKDLFGESEQFFKLALECRQRLAQEKRNELKPNTAGASTREMAWIKAEEIVAASFGSLGHLYHDVHLLPQAEENLMRAVTHLKENKGRAEKKLASLRELAQFYREFGRLPDAARIFNDLIDIQEGGSTGPEARTLADSYFDLAEIFGAQHEGKKSASNFKVATLLQQYAGKYAQEQEKIEDPQSPPDTLITIDDDVDKLGDAYVEMGRYAQASDTYEFALEMRERFTSIDGKRRISYQKLGDLFYGKIKDLDYAQHQNDPDYKEAYKKAVDNYLMLVSFYEPSGASSKPEEYGAALVKLGTLYAKDASTYSGAEERLNRALSLKTSTLLRYETLSALAELYRAQQRDADLERTYIARVKLIEPLVSGNVVVRQTNIDPNLKAALIYPGAVADLANFYGSHNRQDQQLEAYRSLLGFDDNLLNSTVDEKLLTTYAKALDDYAKLLVGRNQEKERQEALERSKKITERSTVIKGVRNTLSPKY